MDTNISVIMFADDLVLIGRTKKKLEKLMDMTIRYFNEHYLDLSQSKSKIISHDASIGTAEFSIPDETNTVEFSLDKVISFKYLGVPISSAPWRFFCDYNQQVKARARSYVSRVLALSRSGPDVAELAYTLWNQIALPSILYGSEVCHLTKDSIDEVEKCQSTVGKFILQVPSSTANVAVNIDVGFRPIWSVVAQKVLTYANNTMMQPNTNWVKKAMTSNINEGIKNSYTKDLIRLKTQTSTFGLGPSKIKQAVKRASIIDILNNQRKTSVTSFALSGPGCSIGVDRYVC